MHTTPDLLPELDLASEYDALLSFVHLAPIGLLRCNRDGIVTMMNPMATQLLAPLGFGPSGDINIFDVLDKASTDIRMLAQELKPSEGLICENYNVDLPVNINEPERPNAPIALRISVMQLPKSSAGDLMFVIQDGSSEVKLQRMRANWYR